MTSTNSPSTLTVGHTYAASPETVFAAWTSAEALRRWYAPVEGWAVSHAEVDARVGGSYSVTFGPAPEGDAYTEHGDYEAVEPGRLLRWRLELTAEEVERTVVEVTFEAVDGGTRVQIIESGYSTAEVAEEHADGWATTLENLAQALI